MGMGEGDILTLILARLVRGGVDIAIVVALFDELLVSICLPSGAVVSPTFLC